jgi:hypothetical protein
MFLNSIALHDVPMDRYGEIRVAANRMLAAHKQLQNYLRRRVHGKGDFAPISAEVEQSSKEYFQLIRKFMTVTQQKQRN